MEFQYNKLGKVLSGNHCGDFCKIEFLNQDDFFVTFLDKNMQEIESKYIANFEELKKMDLQIKFPNKYDDITKETILHDFYDVYGEKDLSQYLETTQKKIAKLFILIDNELIKKMIQDILKENVYIDFTMTNFLCRELILHKNFDGLSTKQKSIINDLLNME